MNAISIRRKEEAEWRASADMRTLIEAEEIRRDPKRLKAAQAQAKEQLVELGAVMSETPKTAT